MEEVWYHRQSIWITILIISIIIFLLVIRVKKNKRQHLSDVVRLWTSVPHSQEIAYESSQFIDGSIFTPRSITTSSFYGSESYMNCLKKLQAIYTDLGSGSVPEDCYTLSTNVIPNMTVDDTNRNISNIILKCIPAANMAISKKSMYDLAAITLLMYYMVFRILAFSTNGIVTGVFDSAQEIVSIQLRSSIFLPSSSFPMALETYYQLLNSPLDSVMTSSGITNYITNISQTFKTLVKNLIENVIQPLVVTKSESLRKYPSQITILPVDMISPLIGIILMIPLYPNGLGTYVGGNCN